MLKHLVVASVITLITSTSGMAQSAAMKACASDVKSLCAGIQPGDGRVKACIKSHFNDVSDRRRCALQRALARCGICRDDMQQIEGTRPRHVDWKKLDLGKRDE